MIKQKGNWGKNAFWPLKSERFVWAFKRNISSKHVWIPISGAAIARWGGYDDKIANWVAQEHHLFIDHKHADDWSDLSNNILKYEVYTTTLLTPSFEENGNWADWTKNKVKGGAVIAVASTSARYIHDRTSEAFPRYRPNLADNHSFPSSHTTKASSYNILAHKNLDEINMNNDVRLGLKIVSTTFAATTVWARVEGHRHYPSDVLAGYAMGSFVSGFLYDALMNSDPNQVFAIVPSGQGWIAQYAFQF